MSSDTENTLAESEQGARAGDMDAGDPTSGLDVNGELPDEEASSTPQNSGPAGDVGPGGGSAGPEAHATQKLLPDTPADRS